MKRYLLIAAFLVAVWFVYSRFVAPRMGGSVIAA